MGYHGQENMQKIDEISPKIAVSSCRVKLIFKIKIPPLRPSTTARDATVGDRSGAARAPAIQAISCRVTRAGHFRYFIIFSIIKNDFFASFLKLITNFCTSPI